MTLDEKAIAWTEAWADRSRRAELTEEAKAIAAEHHAELAATFEGLSGPDIVGYVEQARADGDDAAVGRANIWMIANLPKQTVVGAA